MAKRTKSTFQRLQLDSLNRSQRRELARRLESATPELELVHPDAAGIDIGGASHFVAVPPDRDAHPVREFGSWTADLQRMAGWLKACGIRTVAMQSTGVYWMAALEVLEQAGFEVFLVNARGTKNLPGRKSDVQESQWLRKLHSYGLLRNSFRPPEQIRAVRTIWRHRQRWVSDAGRSIQQMQKALIMMNLQLSNHISDLSGFTGMAIVRAIVGGERDPKQLAELRDRRIAASKEEIAHSLEGHWREDVLFELRQLLEAYDFYQKQITACDSELAKHMAALPDNNQRLAVACQQDCGPRRDKSKYRKNRPAFDLGAELRRTMGVDVTRIDGIDVLTAQVIVSEVGTDLSAFPDEDHFAAWLGLTPRRDISGGKVIRQVRGEGSNRIANALRMAAQALSRSDSYLGARYRTLRARLGPPKAVKAMARYLACLVYRLMTNGQEYVDRGAQHYESRRQERERTALKRKAAALGFQLIPV